MKPRKIQGHDALMATGKRHTYEDPPRDLGWLGALILLCSAALVVWGAWKLFG